MEEKRNRSIKEGDIYKFRYNEQFMKGNFEPYHCFDGILTVKPSYEKGLILVDGYWSSDNRWFTLDKALSEGELTFICNVNEVEVIKEYESMYYNEKDIFRLPFHSGYHTVYYKRKGAEKCKETILNQLTVKVQQAESSLTSAQRGLEWAKESLEKAKKENEVNKIYL